MAAIWSREIAPNLEILGHEICGVGIGSPGPLDAEAGIVVHASTLRGWDDVPLAALAAARLGRPVRVDNDANVAALAEWRFGAGRGLRHMVYVTVSTGIGGGVILDGRLLHGRGSMAGEIGHMAITEAPVPCSCGALGCWEALASGPALGARATALGSLGRVTARDVARLAEAGDAIALGLLAEEARYLGLGFANLLHLYAPEMIVVGGGVSECLPAMRADIEGRDPAAGDAGSSRRADRGGGPGSQGRRHRGRVAGAGLIVRRPWRSCRADRSRISAPPRHRRPHSLGAHPRG